MKQVIVIKLILSKTIDKSTVELSDAWTEMSKPRFLSDLAVALLLSGHCRLNIFDIGREFRDIRTISSWNMYKMQESHLFSWIWLLLYYHFTRWSCNCSRTLTITKPLTYFRIFCNKKWSLTDSATDHLKKKSIAISYQSIFHTVRWRRRGICRYA